MAIFLRNAIGIVVLLSILFGISFFSIKRFQANSSIKAQATSLVDDAPPPAIQEASVQIVLEPITSDLVRPTFATHANDGSNRLFVVELDGYVKIVEGGEVLKQPFLNLNGTVTAREGEQGFYSLAFHPNYLRNGRFFVSYTEANTGDLIVMEHQVSQEDPNFADDEAFAKEILRIDPAEAFHHGGQLAFGPDDYLYVGIGDGIFSAENLRAAADEMRSGSRLSSSIVRLDIDAEDPYAIPNSNPFVGRSGVKMEIYAYGFRNPWKFSFDRKTGELYVSDVGVDHWEEINLVQAGGFYGWPVKEADDCFKYFDDYSLVDPDCPNQSNNGYSNPLFYYPHLSIDPEGGNAVTGGYVYRGKRFPELEGRYFFADFISGRIWSLERRDSLSVELLLDTDHAISSLVEDEAGELYILTIAGELYQITANQN